MNEHSHTRPKDVWASGTAYEPYVGRWSRQIARQFLEWLAAPLDCCWLDVGCGTGALTETILGVAVPKTVIAVDSAAGYLDFARENINDARVHFETGDAQSLPVQTASCDMATSGLMLNFVPQPHLAVSEMVRAVRPGGTVAAYVWDYAGRMQFMRHFWNAVAELDPAARELDEGRRFPLCNPEALSELFRDCDLKFVETAPIDIWTVFRDFDDFWLPFLGGQGPAPGYAASLDEPRRSALRKRLLAALPFAVDGTIPLMARAWAVRGVR